MNSFTILAWRASAGIESDSAVLALKSAAGEQVFENIPPARLAALIAVLESSQAATCVAGPDGKPWITNAPNPPGA